MLYFDIRFIPISFLNFFLQNICIGIFRYFIHLYIWDIHVHQCIIGWFTQLCPYVCEWILMYCKNLIFLFQIILFCKSNGLRPFFWRLRQLFSFWAFEWIMKWKIVSWILAIVSGWHEMKYLVSEGFRQRFQLINIVYDKSDVHSQISKVIQMNNHVTESIRIVVWLKTKHETGRLLYVTHTLFRVRLTCTTGCRIFSIASEQIYHYNDLKKNIKE